jgi:hypothetical protein
VLEGWGCHSELIQECVCVALCVIFVGSKMRNSSANRNSHRQKNHCLVASVHPVKGLCTQFVFVGNFPTIRWTDVAFLCRRFIRCYYDAWVPSVITVGGRLPSFRTRARAPPSLPPPATTSHERIPVHLRRLLGLTTGIHRRPSERILCARAAARMN